MREKRFVVAFTAPLSQVKTGRNILLAHVYKKLLLLLTHAILSLIRTGVLGSTKRC
jgi:hypothetical protein